MSPARRCPLRFEILPGTSTLGRREVFVPDGWGFRLQHNGAFWRASLFYPGVTPEAAIALREGETLVLSEMGRVIVQFGESGGVACDLIDDPRLIGPGVHPIALVDVG